jgi:hypothetical protein
MSFFHQKLKKGDSEEDERISARQQKIDEDNEDYQAEIIAFEMHMLPVFVEEVLEGVKGVNEGRGQFRSDRLFPIDESSLFRALKFASDYGFWNQDLDARLRLKGRTPVEVAWFFDKWIESGYQPAVIGMRLFNNYFVQANGRIIAPDYKNETGDLYVEKNSFWEE